jgi:hypothetical protein
VTRQSSKGSVAVMAKRYSARELQVGAQALNSLLRAYLRGEPEAKQHVEPLVRQYLQQRGAPAPSKAELASAAWQIWLRQGKQLPRQIDGTAKLRAEHGLPPLWGDAEGRDDILRQVRQCIPRRASAAPRGRPTDEITSVARIYRIISAHASDVRSGVRPEESALLLGARDTAWLIVNGSGEFEDIPDGELVTRKTSPKRA